MYVPFAGDRGSKEAWMDLESQTMLNLISMLVQNSNHGRSPSEIAHDTLNASYPHHARGGVLTLPRKKWAHPPFVSKRPSLGDWRQFLNKEESYETRQTCD